MPVRVLSLLVRLLGAHDPVVIGDRERCLQAGMNDHITSGFCSASRRCRNLPPPHVVTVPGPLSVIKVYSMDPYAEQK